MKLAARWTDDCSGKKDYDGDVLSISTRYWPADGGFYILDGGEFRKNDVLAKPSASSSLLLWNGEHGTRKESGEYVTLAEEEFEADSFEEVARKVETWAQAITDRAVSALMREFGGQREEGKNG